MPAERAQYPIVSAIALLWAASVLLLAPRAPAADDTEPARATLSIAPELSGCVEAGALMPQVHRAIGRQVFFDDDADVRVVVLSASHEHSATIELRNAENDAALGTRTLQASSCTELVETLSLTLSLMLDFQVTEIAELEERERARQSAESSPPPPTHETPTAKEEQQAAPPKNKEPTGDQPSKDKGNPAETPQAPPPAEPAAQPRWHLALNGRAGWGLSPASSVGLDVGGGVELPSSWLLELAVGSWAESRFSRQGGELTLGRQDLRGTVCPSRFANDPWAIRLCAHGDAAIVSAASRGFEEDAGARDIALGLGAGVDVRYLATSSVFFRVAAGANAALRRARLVAERGGAEVELFQMAPVAAHIAVGLGLQL